MTSSHEPSTDRFPNGYRYSNEFIKRWERILTIVLVLSIAVGIGMGFLGDGIFGNGGAPDAYKTASAFITFGGIALVVATAFILGANAIHRYGGLVISFFLLTIPAILLGILIQSPLLTVASIVLAVALFVFFIYLSVISKVPMWLQLPILNSPRLYIREKEKGEKTRNEK